MQTMTEADLARLRELVRARVRNAGSSFFWAMRLMSAERREAMYAVYAFCREVDDIADEPAPPEDKARRLDEWGRAIDTLYAGGVPALPLALALAAPVRRFDLRASDFHAVIDGCRMDGANLMVRPPMATLDLYCDRVASAVGRLSVRVFGPFEPRALDVAWHQGRALQFTNILRDVREDAGIGRLYLPAELIEAHGIEATDIASILADPALVGVCRDLGASAREHYARAREAMAECNAATMRPAKMMLGLYEDVLGQVEAAGWLPPRPVKMGKAAKMWSAIRHGLF